MSRVRGPRWSAFTTPTHPLPSRRHTSASPNASGGRGSPKRQSREALPPSEKLPPSAKRCFAALSYWRARVGQFCLFVFFPFYVKQKLKGSEDVRRCLGRGLEGEGGFLRGWNVPREISLIVRGKSISYYIMVSLFNTPLTVC